MLPKKILICVGTRPNFMKIAPIIRELNTCTDRIKYEIVHTGQHYDSNMSDVFFDDLELPLPTYYLGGDTDNPAEKISSLIKRVSDICIYSRPDLVMVVGDVDSTLACAIAANKCGIPIAHIESGERSYDKTMPEEINRILVDNLSTYLFCSTENAINNLSFENIDTENAFFSGNLMIDSLLFMNSKLFNIAPVHIKYYIVATIHRGNNVDNPKALRIILTELNTIAKKIPVFFPIHPRTRKQITDFDFDSLCDNITMLAPMSYLDFLSLVSNAALVITDSGGLQIESGVLKTPCITVRNSTEHTCTINAGTNILSKIDNIFDNSIHMLNKVIEYPEFGDGKAAVRIVEKLKEILNV